MAGFGKKALYITSGSYTSGPSGASIFNDSLDTDAFRKDMSLTWRDSNLQKGVYGVPFKGQDQKSGLIDWFYIGDEDAILHEDGGETRTVYFAHKDYSNKIVPILKKIGQLNENPNPNAVNLVAAMFRQQILGKEHYEYVVAGQNKGGTFDKIYEGSLGHSLSDYPVIKTGKVFKDYTFQLVTPFDKEEVEAMASFTKPYYVDYSSEYIFTETEYESVIQKSTIPESLLPNFYSYLTSEFADDPATTTISPGNLDPDSKKPFFANYAKELNTIPQQQKDVFEKQQENIGITANNLKFITDYNDKSVFFPMHNRIEFDTQKTNILGPILEQASLFQPLMKWAIDSFANAQALQDLQQGNNANGFFFIKDPFIVSRNVTEVSQGEPVGLVNDLAKIVIPNADAGNALDNFVESTDLWYSKEFVKQYSTMIGNIEDKDLDADKPISFAQIILSFIARGKLKKLIKDKSRSYKEILEGKPAYSEIIMYRVSKHPIDSNGNPTSLPTQNYWVSNPEDASKIVLYDTQVKYDKTYRYFIYAYVAIVGTEYEYSNLNTENVLTPDGNTYDGRWYADVKVRTTPKLRLMQVPYYGFSNTEDSDLHIFDDPPPAPDVSFIPIRGSINKIKIYMNGNVDRYEMLPIIIQDTDVEIFEKIRKFQKKKPQEKIKFETDDQSAAYEVFRIGPDPISGITPAPTSYEDFKDLLVYKVNDANLRPAGSVVDTLLPNKKYYYCFRTVDIHDNISIPTAVFEVELQSQPGISLGYPVIRVYEFGEKEPKVATKSLRRYLHLRATLPQVFIPQVEGEDKTTAIGKNIKEVGVTEQKLFASEDSEENINNTKKFKIRLTSRQTGRKIDVNVRFVYKQTE